MKFNARIHARKCAKTVIDELNYCLFFDVDEQEKQVREAVQSAVYHMLNKLKTEIKSELKKKKA